MRLELEEVDIGEVQKILGYSDDNPAPGHLSDRIAALAASVPHAVSGVAVTSRINSHDARGVETGLGFISSPGFSQLAVEAEKVVYAVVTAGPEMDECIHTCEDMVDSMALDAIGSVIVEQGVDAMRNFLADQHGAYISLPFSPGYCDYPLHEQESIFSALGGAPLGICFHPGSFMMTPVKTVSFIAATGKTPLNTNPCSLCTLKRCMMRRAS